MPYFIYIYTEREIERKKKRTRVNNNYQIKVNHKILINSSEHTEDITTLLNGNESFICIIIGFLWIKVHNFIQK